MSDFLAFFEQNKVDDGLAIFLMLFSLGIALFQTFIFSGLYDLKFPTWLFFVLTPAVIGITHLINASYTLMVFVFLFASIFIFGIIGMIYGTIQQNKKDKKAEEILNRKYKIEKTPLKDLFLVLAIVGGCIYAFIWLAEREKLPLLFVIIPGLIVVKRIFFPSRKSKFLKLQEMLPTSKVNSIAMGVVEVIGDLEEIEPLISPHFNKPCIGYFFKIEKEGKRDSDGDTTYHTVHTEQKVGVFKIKDETGSVTVNGDGLEFFFDRIDKRNGGKTRYSETYLLPNDNMLLIGYADSDNGEVIINKGNEDTIFGVGLPGNIAYRNKVQPLLNSFLTTLFFITLILLFIILN